MDFDQKIFEEGLEFESNLLIIESTSDFREAEILIPGLRDAEALEDNDFEDVEDDDFEDVEEEEAFDEYVANHTKDLSISECANLEFEFNMIDNKEEQ